MSRLIDADELIRKIQEKEREPEYQHEGESWSVGLIMAEEIIDSAPTVDVEPVKHGEWIGLEYDGYADGNPVYDLWECSHCNCEWDGEEDTLPNYCPDCGAEMEMFNLIRENYHKVNEDYIQEQIKAATDYLDCNYCKHKPQDNYIDLRCLSCMRNYGIYTKEDNEDMADEYGWPKFDRFELMDKE